MSHDHHSQWYCSCMACRSWRSHRKSKTAELDRVAAQMRAANARNIAIREGIRRAKFARSCEDVTKHSDSPCIHV